MVVVLVFFLVSFHEFVSWWCFLQYFEFQLKDSSIKVMGRKPHVEMGI